MSSNIIELKFEQIGSNYSVELRAGIEGKAPEVIINRTIPTFDRQQYQVYQQACRKLYDRHSRLGLKSASVTTAADLAEIRQNLDESADNLLQTLNDWGKSPQFNEIAEAIESRSENLRVTISTECGYLRKLPLHKWNLFPHDVEVIFSGIESSILKRTRHPEQIRILAILGDKRGIDIDKDKQAIEAYCKTDAELVFLAQPTRELLTTTLADCQGWDIIFFSGHSSTDRDLTGRICINETDSLTIAELQDVLKPAVRIQVWERGMREGIVKSQEWAEIASRKKAIAERA